MRLKGAEALGWVGSWQGHQKCFKAPLRLQGGKRGAAHCREGDTGRKTRVSARRSPGCGQRGIL